MKKLTAGSWIYTREEFKAEQATWCDEDTYKNYNPRKEFVIITDDGVVVETDEEMLDA